MLRVCKNKFDMMCLNSIASDLAQIGFNKNTKAFVYLSHAIFFTMQKRGLVEMGIAKLFAKIAEFYNIKPKNIEKACRYALDVAYFDGKIENVNNVLGIKYLKRYEKPHLATFIAVLAEKHIIQHDKLILESKKNFTSTLKTRQLLTPIKTVKIPSQRITM